MYTNNNPLCCCEYLDVQQERNHILACCCNCQDLDEGFDSLISGRGIPNKNRFGLLTTLQDRCRIPWIGGARKIKIYLLLPLIFILGFLLVATISPRWTVFSGCMMLIFLTCIRHKLVKNFSKSRFFFNWTITSIIILYLLFEFVVITLLEILWEENVALTALIVFSTLCFWKVKSKNYTNGNSGQKCNICEVHVSAASEHVVWLNCCIGSHNKTYYILGLISTSIALLYHANLTLTSVCLPYTMFGMILLPSNCSDAYDLIELRISLVSGLYSFLIAIFTLFLLIRQILLLLLRYCIRSSRINKSYFFV